MAVGYLIVIDFDDLDGLQTYLRHPAHEELGARFNQLLSSALIDDFEVGVLEQSRVHVFRPAVTNATHEPCGGSVDAASAPCV